MPFLSLRGRDGELVVHRLDPGEARQEIGRRSANSLCISWDSEVSGVHAELVQSGGEWVVDDISTYGTFVNGERVHARRRLKDGDRLRVGRTAIAFHGGGPSEFSRTDFGGGSPVPEQLTAAQRRVLGVLCRPYLEDDRFAAPPTNKQIASELFVGEDAVTGHLKTLYKSFNIQDLPPNQKRVALAALVIEHGLLLGASDG
jgi:FHA domain